ncbi:uridine kinase family protein [Bacillus sp. SD088]|uniref:uridine kinase family protein n=1 Tax=Bacillus sp. SD088 TaxID=2782012 RepID=UPI001A97B248|nr:phosphoribulokinase [Bacillus sp. SD088]MBO0992746.1 phosphoribulokinase [Bacillus sp. SD088]
MDRLIRQIIGWASKADQRIVVGISGHGAAGKTTFANKLISQLDQNEVNYMNTDPYIVSSAIRKHSAIDYTYQNKNHRYKMTACHPAAHHLPSLERDVQMISAGFDLYTIETHYMKSNLISANKKLTIVEGMSVAFINQDLFDLNIYFYTDGETEFERRTSRDVIERGTDLEYLKQSHVERRIQYEVFMHPYSQQFNIIIKTSIEGSYLEKSTFEFD